MIKITDNVLEELSLLAKQSPRKRQNRVFHYGNKDTLQRMLNALEPGSYTHPHKHQNPDKREVFLILMGKIVAVEFDNNGKILDYLVLEAGSKNKAVEIPPHAWHTLIPLEERSVIYELKDGPYNKATDKTFAAWAPEEGTKEAQTFNLKILKKLGL